MRRILTAVIMAAMVPAMPAAAQTTGGQPAQRSAQLQDGAQICRQVTVTGSLFARRACKTAAEWAALERQAHDALDDRRRISAPN